MLVNPFKQYFGKILPMAAAFVVIGLLTFVSWGNVFLQNAIAMPNRAADIEMSRAASQLNDVVGAGTSKQIKGQVQQGVGTVKRSIGKATSQVEGTTDQLQGKVNRDIGRTQRAASQVGDQIEDSTEGLVDSVKGLFGQ